MKSDNKNEIFPIVDEAGKVVGRATRGECHSGSRLLHPVVHLHVYDAQRRLYLQRRPEWKDIQPGKWDTAVGGHIDYGENVEEALRREAREELGLTGFEAEYLTSYVFESDREREYVNVFRTTVAPDAVNPSDELDGGRWWTAEEIAASADMLTPNLRQELQRLQLI
ncbi:MAG: NUDIX domain-containing protein [Muribaculaceae bacterium]|nr:NUDIX domain-containing protein [Muribaculaceae bacterium]